MMDTDFDVIVSKATQFEERVKVYLEKIIQNKIKEVEAEYNCKIDTVCTNPVISQELRAKDSYMIYSGYVPIRFELNTSDRKMFHFCEYLKME